MIPEGWRISTYPLREPGGRWEWMVSTNMPFLFVGRRSYVSQAAAKRAARKALDRFMGRFVERDCVI